MRQVTKLVSGDVVIGTMTEQVVTVTKRIGTANIFLGVVEKEWNPDKPVASISSSLLLAAWFL